MHEKAAENATLEIVDVNAGDGAWNFSVCALILEWNSGGNLRTTPNMQVLKGDGPTCSKFVNRFRRTSQHNQGALYDHLITL